MPDFTWRGLRTEFHYIVAIGIALFAESQIDGPVDVTRLVVSAGAIIGLFAAGVNALEDNTNFPAIGKAAPPANNPVAPPDEGGPG